VISPLTVTGVEITAVPPQYAVKVIEQVGESMLYTQYDICGGVHGGCALD